MFGIKTITRAPLKGSRRVFVISMVVLTLVLPLPIHVQAAAGDLDASFGIGGKVTTDFSSDFDEAFDLAVQPDGKIIAGGQTGFGPSSGFEVARYTPDGTLDATFGSGG